MLVSGRSELSKNVFGYNSPQNWKELFFPDIANLTIMTASDNTVVTVALSAIQSDSKSDEGRQAKNGGVKGRDGSAEELDRETGEEQITVGWARRKDGG